MSRPSLFTLVERRAPLVVVAAKLRDLRIKEWLDSSSEQPATWTWERIAGGCLVVNIPRSIRKDEVLD